MAKAESQMLELGTTAPAFSLPDAIGRRHSLSENARAYLVMFICNHCPFVKHVRGELARLGKDFAERGVAMYAINSNDAEAFPGDSPEMMIEEIKNVGYDFPYLVDADQTAAKAYKAACTPDFYLFDEKKKLVYRGQLDDSRPGNSKPVNGKDLRTAIDAVLAGDVVAEFQMPSVGCSIKWRAGNEPDYFG